MSMPEIAGGMASIGPWPNGTDSKKVRTVKSAERTLALFELFSLTQQPMTVGEISGALGIPQPSVSMLVRNLTKLGYLEQDRVMRTYVPTIRIMLLGRWVQMKFTQENKLETWLQRLVVEIGETMVVAIQNGIYSQYVLAQLPDNLKRLEVQSGLLRPITCTAVGRALLSLKPDAEIEATVRRCNAEVQDEKLRVNIGAFMEKIYEIRQQGYARTCGDMTSGNSVIAVTLSAPIGRMPVAVGVGGAISAISAKQTQILEALNVLKSQSYRHSQGFRIDAVKAVAEQRQPAFDVVNAA